MRRRELFYILFFGFFISLSIKMYFRYDITNLSDWKEAIFFASVTTLGVYIIFKIINLLEKQQ